MSLGFPENFGDLPFLHLKEKMILKPKFSIQYLRGITISPEIDRLNLVP